MRKSLECLFKDDKSGELEKISESLTNVESPEAFTHSYDMAQQKQLEEGAYTRYIHSVLINPVPLKYGNTRGRSLSNKADSGVSAWEV
jgi:hypothetical protein